MMAKMEFLNEIEFHHQAKERFGLHAVLCYRIDLIGDAANFATGRRFFPTVLEIAFSTLYSAYYGILILADGVGGISVFITNAITIAVLSFSSRHDRRLRQASLATKGDRKKIICWPDPS